MVYLPPNKLNIAIRCLSMLPPLVIGAAFVASPGTMPLGMIVFALILTSLVVALLIIGLLGAVKLEEDDKSKKIIVSTLFKTKIFSISEITGYYVSVYRSRRIFVSYGRILIMKDGKRLELYPGNISDIDNIDQLMTNYSIPLLGEKKPNYPFSIIFNSPM